MLMPQNPTLSAGLTHPDDSLDVHTPSALAAKSLLLGARDAGVPVPLACVQVRRQQRMSMVHMAFSISCTPPRRQSCVLVASRILRVQCTHTSFFPYACTQALVTALPKQSSHDTAAEQAMVVALKAAITGLEGSDDAMRKNME